MDTAWLGLRDVPLETLVGALYGTQDDAADLADAGFSEQAAAAFISSPFGAHLAGVELPDLSANEFDGASPIGIYGGAERGGLGTREEGSPQSARHRVGEHDAGDTGRDTVGEPSGPSGMRSEDGSAGVAEPADQRQSQTALSAMERLKRRRRKSSALTVDWPVDQWESLIDTSKRAYGEELSLESAVELCAEFEYTPESQVPCGRISAQFDDGLGAEPGDELGDIAAGDQAQRRVLIRWDQKEVTGSGVVYRVVADTAARDEIHSPEQGTVFELTEGNAAIHDVPDNAGYQHYQVWMDVLDEGDDESGAQTQPRLVGETLVVFPPRWVSLREDQGRVNGSWDSLDGHEEVRVFAAPASSDQAPQANPANELRTGVTNKSFVHPINTTVDRMSYQLVPQVTYRGETREGEPTRIRSTDVQGSPERTELLALERVSGANRDEIQASWIAPVGRLRVCLTQREPVASLYEHIVPERALASDPALSQGIWCYDEEVEAGKPQEFVTDWPNEWHEVHVVLVTTRGGKNAVSPSKVLQRVSPLENPRLVERGESQVITFAWPAGAELVRYQVGDDSPMDLTEVDYRRAGGIRLSLPTTSTKVTLTPRNIYNGEETIAEPSVLLYPGRAEYRYSLGISSFFDNSGGVQPQQYPRLQLMIWRTQGEDLRPPTFVLVRNSRLPLHASDGAIVRTAECSMADAPQPHWDWSLRVQPHMLPAGQEGADRMGRVWLVHPNDVERSAYYRLFIVEDTGQAVPQSGGASVFGMGAGSAFGESPMSDQAGEEDVQQVRYVNDESASSQLFVDLNREGIW
ncbi:hypothetical protein [Corynebacterium heidelbergense]|uniref:Uncharacterized protein n=1 Tax=Corynebacterium heidelbergense TaxID=2055947 RepID=A0A364V921_9CORY|nr:hypothetical protein [Corynebacterium heidelbergense]RAV33066.1 hypothetical protein DLJ54_00525 [Corynebacterium heidelbergense]